MWPFRRPAASGQGLGGALPPAAARYAVVDTELTGLDERRDCIVSVGGLRMAHGRIDLADRFYEVVRPTAALTASSILLHGITPEEARERPEICDVLAAFAAFCADDILVGHFLEIDANFLRKEFARCGLPAPANPLLDTWALYDWLSSRSPDDGGTGLPRLQDPRLPELAQALGVPPRGGHHALGDAFVTAQVFQRLLRRLPRWGILTTGALLRVASPSRVHERHRDGAVPLA